MEPKNTKNCVMRLDSFHFYSICNFYFHCIDSLNSMTEKRKAFIMNPMIFHFHSPILFIYCMLEFFMIMMNDTKK